MVITKGYLITTIILITTIFPLSMYIINFLLDKLEKKKLIKIAIQEIQRRKN